jgi:tetratricopeptide (TPR) repeat protein
MSGLIYYTDQRKVLPFLERVEEYIPTGDLSIPVVRNKIDSRQLPRLNLRHENLDEKLRYWRNNHDFHLAGDLLSHALVTDDFEITYEIKTYLLNKYPKNAVLKWLFERSPKALTLSERIEFNHQRLEIEERDSLTWTDQAINFIESNDRDESIRCIEVALRIDSNLGFIVRNASRILNLTGDTNRSISVLKKSEHYKYDPQIVSAEIAFSQLADRRTDGLGIADKLIKNKKFAKRELSELASTLGTAEFLKKRYKKSEGLFDLALIDPNSNSLAQALWYKLTTPEADSIPEHLASGEILTHLTSKESLFEKSAIHATRWRSEEPYSHRPYQVGAQISGDLLGDFESAHKLITQSYSVQRDIKGEQLSEDEERSFCNDIAYYLLRSGRIDEATPYVKRLADYVNSSSPEEIRYFVNVATIGLYNYKVGNIKEGETYYRAAVKYFEGRNVYMEASAFINFCQEAIQHCGTIDEVLHLQKELEDRVGKDSKNDILLRKNRVLESMDMIIKTLGV